LTFEPLAKMLVALLLVMSSLFRELYRRCVILASCGVVIEHN